jgi:hypothetical protein
MIVFVVLVTNVDDSDIVRKVRIVLIRTDRPR